MALNKAKKEKLSVTSIEDVAACFGVITPSVKKWIEAGMPRHRTSGPEAKSPRYTYYIWEIAPWLRKQGPWRYPPGGGGKGENRGVRGGTELSEEIQRVKLAKEKLLLSVARGKLIDVSEMRELLMRWAQRRRREIETARIQFGAAVANFLNEGLKEEDRAIDNDFPGQ